MDVSRETSAAAQAIFGDHLSVAQKYADFLATAGVERGLIGPGETPRLWGRHLLNCAALSRAIPSGASVLDVGSGAGLPGLVLALLRADIVVALIEPMQRRTEFLTEAVARLALTNVVIHRARAEDMLGDPADVVTARAVAPLAKLAGWCLPLVAPGGELLAMKGAAAPTELAAAVPTLRRLGAQKWWIESLWAGDQMDATIVVRVAMRALGVDGLAVNEGAANRDEGNRDEVAGQGRRHRAPRTRTARREPPA